MVLFYCDIDFDYIEYLYVIKDDFSNTANVYQSCLLQND